MKRTTLFAGAIGATLMAAPIQPAAAYPIDCAILLCLAGGFPPSVECTAAKAEMIRRITPYPVEPPLQLWNCPMTVGADVARAIGMSNARLGPDGLTPDVRKYRDGIEIYHIERYYDYTSGKDENHHYKDKTYVGSYAEDGSFSWHGASFANGPEWLHQAAGFTPGREVRNIRGVAMRYRDHEGNITTEFVRY